LCSKAHCCRLLKCLGVSSKGSKFSTAPGISVCCAAASNKMGRVVRHSITAWLFIWNATNQLEGPFLEVVPRAIRLFVSNVGSTGETGFWREVLSSHARTVVDQRCFCNHTARHRGIFQYFDNLEHLVDTVGNRLLICSIALHRLAIQRRCKATWLCCGVDPHFLPVCCHILVGDDLDGVVEDPFSWTRVLGSHGGPGSRSSYCCCTGHEMTLGEERVSLERVWIKHLKTGLLFGDYVIACTRLSKACHTEQIPVERPIWLNARPLTYRTANFNLLYLHHSCVE
jgi:hypothetical protein